MLTSLYSRIARLGFRPRLLLGLSVLFLLLVAARIHGSSIALSSKFWAPNQSHYIAQPLLDALGEKGKKLEGPLMAQAKVTRSDEWSISTLWSLAQFQHEPKFPVINRNIGRGQNMLLISWVPVFHLSAVARPVTWGYMLFGQQSGLAWYWWFSPFFCFATLFFVFEVIFPRDRFLAILGAFWFCASAYVISWSHYPAYLVAFAGLTFLGGHGVLVAGNLRRVLLWGALLGYGISGVVMCLYIPWIVPLGYTFAAILLGVIIRDRLITSCKRSLVFAGLAAAGIVAAIVLGSFLYSAMTELKALANSAYPGVRRLNGGDNSLARLFGGFYNFVTLRKSLLKMPASEWAGFFLFLPTVVLAAILSPRLRRRIDPIGWCLLPIGVGLALYGQFKFPQWLANITLWSRFQGYRAQVATGFISIVLSLMLLSRRRPSQVDAPPALDPSGPPPPASPSTPTFPGGTRERASQVDSRPPATSESQVDVQQPGEAVVEAPRPKPIASFLGRPVDWESVAVGLIVLGSFAFFVVTGATLQAIARMYRTAALVPWPIWIVSLGAAAGSFMLVRGYRRAFTAALVPTLIVTAGDFNPVSLGFPALEKSEMYQAIWNVKASERAAGKEGMWVVSGGPHLPIIGTVASAMGAHSMTGVFYHPQLNLWHALDSERRQETIYNRYSETHYFPLAPGDPTVRFTLPMHANFNVRIAPDNPLLLNLGVRHALTYDRHTPYVNHQSLFPLVYESPDRRLRIWQLTP